MDIPQKMRIKLQLILTLLIAPAVFSEDCNYCALETCENGTHTLCEFPNFGLSSRCRNVVRAEIVEHQVNEIVNVHNSYRTPSQYMLKWDQELAFIAQRWADQCENVVDKCRNVERFNVTQRIDVHQSSSHVPFLSKSIQRWHDHDNKDKHGFKYIKLCLGEGSSSPPLDCHQIPWRKANRIGCGLIRTYDKKHHKLYFVCNYGYMIENEE